MCGIVGFVNYKQNLLNYKKILQNMNNSLSKRGPDEEGYYLKEHVGLAHRRLIVIDPIGGKQPMISSKTEKKDRPQIRILQLYIMVKFTIQKNYVKFLRNIILLLRVTVIQKFY